MTDNIFSVKGRVALVSGASSGLGEHIAELLASHGVAVICAARRIDLLRSVAERIMAKGGKALAVEMLHDRFHSSTVLILWLDSAGNGRIIGQQHPKHFGLHVGAKPSRSRPLLRHPCRP